MESGDRTTYIRRDWAESAEKIRRDIVEELKKRTDLFSHPLLTAGSLYLLKRSGYWKEEWKKVVEGLLVKELDGESIRYVVLLAKELGLDTTPLESRLDELFDEDRKLWRYKEGFEGDPLTSSALLIALWRSGMRGKYNEVLEGILHSEGLPPSLASLIGGQRPVLTNLYRALALTIHDKEEEARKIWDILKKGELVDKPPKYLLDRGMKRDVHYPAVLAAVLSYLLREDPSPYLEKLRDFDPKKWDNVRLVTVGFYLDLLLELISSRL